MDKKLTAKVGEIDCTLKVWGRPGCVVEIWNSPDFAWYEYRILDHGKEVASSDNEYGSAEAAARDGLAAAAALFASKSGRQLWMRQVRAGLMVIVCLLLIALDITFIDGLPTAQEMIHIAVELGGGIPAAIAGSFLVALLGSVLFGLNLWFVISVAGVRHENN